MESTNKPECPKCESFLGDNGRCKNCETQELFALGLKISKAQKKEKLELEWDVEPTNEPGGVGRRKLD